MSGWNNGYVTDITYLPGWYPQQSPALMALACLMGNVATPMPLGDDAVEVLELGCGHGYGAMVLAASNPTWRITAVDFNPAHIAGAREWAAVAGLTNITFIEADLATLAGNPASRLIPEADFVSLHGVWSWVPEAVKAGIVRLLRDKVRPGGAVHVSYNAMPAWGEAIGMQRLLREGGQRLAFRSDRQAEEGLAMIRALVAADAVHLQRSKLVNALTVRPLSPAYLAHEYLNDHWAPCFMTDVADALADAKLEWVASANLTENFPELMLTEPQRDVMRRFDDPLMRETIKDFCLERSLRHDVFVRGARRIDNTARNAALMDVAIAMDIAPADLPLAADMPAGKAELNRSFYQPIVQAASLAPMPIGALLQLPQVQGQRDNPAELLGMLVGQSLATIVLRPGAPPDPAAIRFNRLATQRLSRNEPLGRVLGLASHRNGGGVTVSVLDLLVMQQLHDGAGDMEALVRLLDVDPERAPRLRQALDNSLQQRMPILRAAGVF